MRLIVCDVLEQADLTAYNVCHHAPNTATVRPLESLNTIDNFSLNRIISLCNHSIYRDGRRFAVYSWGVDPKQTEDQGICPEKAKKSHGKSRQKASTG